MGPGTAAAECPMKVSPKLTVQQKKLEAAVEVLYYGIAGSR
jgi:hypothetical protein